MKKLKDKIRAFIIRLGTVFTAIITVLALHKKANAGTDDTATKRKEVTEIDKKAEHRRKEAVDIILNTDASDLTKEYPDIREAINKGISRFRQRCSELEHGGDY